MTLWATSDLHFNHRRIIELAGRPFADVESMNRGLIAGWNERVRPTDEVWVVGDFGFANAYGWPVANIFAALHGTKHLILGNHDSDSRNSTDVLGLPWASVERYKVIRWNHQHFVLFHHPIEDWDGLARGWLHLHGHTHGHSRPVPHRFDMSVEAWGYRPVSLDELITIAQGQESPIYGHHGPGPVEEQWARAVS